MLPATFAWLVSSILLRFVSRHSCSLSMIRAMYAPRYWPSFLHYPPRYPPRYLPCYPPCYYLCNVSTIREMHAQRYWPSFFHYPPRYLPFTPPTALHSPVLPPGYPSHLCTRRATSTFHTTLNLPPFTSPAVTCAGTLQGALLG